VRSSCLADACAGGPAHGDTVRSTHQAHQKRSERERRLHRWMLDDLGKPRARAVALQVAVKQHGYCTHKKPAFGGDLNAGLVHH